MIVHPDLHARTRWGHSVDLERNEMTVRGAQ